MRLSNESNSRRQGWEIAVWGERTREGEAEQNPEPRIPGGGLAMASGVEQGSFAFPSSSGISRRSVNQAKPGQGAPPTQRRPLALHPDIDPPPPPPRPAFQLLAFVLILFFAALQFLPATHFRDPSDPLRKWIPFVSEPRSSSHSNTGALEEEISANGTQTEKIDIVSWVECMDLRVLAVLINSTLSNSRFPEKVHFHFLIFENDEDKLSYFKLKVLFPEANLDIIGQKEIKDRTQIATQAGEQFWSSVRDIVPFVIPKVYPSLSRFIYVSPNTIVKGSIEELLGVNLGTYAIAAADDCSKSLSNYVDINILKAIQRTAEKTWVSEKPYDENACVPDLNIIVVDAKKLDKYLIDTFIWWDKVLDNGTTSGDGTSPSIILTLYQRYLKLSTTWKLVYEAPRADDEVKVFSYDGDMRVCAGNQSKHKNPSFGDAWRQYLPPKSEIILAH